MARFVSSRGKVKIAVPVGKASHLLPAVVVVLCLSLLAMAAVSLVTVGADPETGPRSTVTSISAQGFQGLRRLLNARGFETQTNRFEDGDKGTLVHGDIEIITPDPGVMAAFAPSSPRRSSDEASSNQASSGAASSEVSSGESASASQDEASAQSSDDRAQTRRQAKSDQMLAKMMGMTLNVPEKRRADHVLYKPLGRVVLVVLPKWTAQTSIKKARWGQDAQLVPPSVIVNQLTFLSPMTEAASPADFDAGDDGDRVRRERLKTTDVPHAGLVNKGSQVPTLDDAPDNKAAYDSAVKQLQSNVPAGVSALKALAESGYPQAQFHLGCLYSGEGGLIPQDADLARSWTERAAQGGVARAMNNLALMYYDGEGGLVDERMALVWFRRAADLGVVDSQYNLGVIYQEGKGVARDPLQAYEWFLIAAKAGDAEADKAAQALRSTLSAKQQNDAMAAIAAFSPGQVDLQTATYDNGDTVVTYDTVAYALRRAHSEGLLRLSGAPGSGVFTAPLTVGKISDLQSITGPNLTPVLLGPNGEALISRLSVTRGRAQPKVPVYVIADPDLLNNQIFGDPQKVVAALQIIDALSPPEARAASSATKPTVIFNLTFNGMAFDRDLLHALSRPPYLAIPLSLLILALGLMWAAFARFGPPVIEAPGAALGRGVRVLADNAARLMAISVKEVKLGPAYAQLVRDEALRLRGYRQANKDESLDELADRLGKLYGANDTYSDLKAKAAQILTVHQLIDLTRKLHAWKADIGKTIGKTEIDGAN